MSQYTVSCSRNLLRSDEEKKEKKNNELTFNDDCQSLIVFLISRGSISHTHGNNVGIDVITSNGIGINIRSIL